MSNLLHVFSSLRDRLARRAAALITQDVLPIDFDDATAATIRAVRPFTATSPERIAAACDAIRYVARTRVAGDVVECGVWRGGMVMAMLRTLLACGDATRDVYLYDTFAGMSEPTERDRSVTGESAESLLARSDRDSGNGIWCKASLADVRANVASVGYPAERVHFVEGTVEKTIPATLPSLVSLLRLDTDWYESTKHELTHLYPRLSTGGILIIDDYGHWSGARQAVDEYVDENALALFLGRTDYTGRIAVKP